MNSKGYEIADKLGEEEILCQLSEECAELTQACLKYRRALKGLTPKTKEEVKDNLIEELADVLFNIDQIIYLFNKHNVDESIEQAINNIRDFKTDRWYRRTFVLQKEEN